VLNAHLFESVAELQAITDAWLDVYKQERPHYSLAAAPHVSAEAFISRRVYFRTVYLPGKLT
jgi:hypothetical protein